MRPGFDARPDATCGLSLLVSYSDLRSFSPNTRVSLSTEKATFDLICFNY